MTFALRFPLRRAPSPMPVAAVLLLAACSSSSEPEPAGASFPTSPLVTVKSEGGKLDVAAFTAPEQPPSRGTISVKLSVTDPATGKAVEGLVIEMAPEMPSMGHGTHVVPKVSAEGDGTYLAEDVNVYMAGRWDLRLTVSGAVSDVAIIPVDVR